MTIWPADSGFLPVLTGTQIIKDYYNGDLTGIYTNTAGTPPVEWMEQSASSGNWPEDFNASWTEASGRAVKLFTGSGKALRQQQTLFDLSAGLTLEQYLDWNVPDWGFWHQAGNFLWTGNPSAGVPSAQIALGALGNLGDDGQLWTVQSAGQELDITPTVAGGAAAGSSSAAQANVSTPASSAASANNVTGSLPGQQIITLQSLMVVSNAVSVGGTNWAAVKTNDYVYVKATLSTDDANAANQINWSVGEKVAYDPFQIKVSKATSVMIPVTATLGSTNKTVNLWILWGTVCNSGRGHNSDKCSSIRGLV